VSRFRRLEISVADDPHARFVVLSLHGIVHTLEMPDLTVGPRRCTIAPRTRCTYNRRWSVAEVGVAQLRRELKNWLDRAQSGDEVVITDRGRPVARLSGIDVAPLLDRLAEEGRLSGAPGAHRPTARGRRRVEADGDVAALVAAERDARR
jgi:prevent-host-death family protein